ncbi:MAG: dipeptidase [Anaerolineae bacterium]
MAWQRLRHPEHWLDLHAESTVVDLHVHPALKAAWFRKDLRRDNPLDNPLNRLLEVDPAGVSPLTLRTDFPKLVNAGVDVALSTVYALEHDSLHDFVFRVGPIRGIDFQVIRPLLPVFFPRLWRDHINTDYFASITKMMDLLEEEAAQFAGVRVVKDQAALTAALDDGVTALIDAVEGGHCLEGPETRARRERYPERKLPQYPAEDRRVIREELSANLEQLAARGAAYITLTHFFPSALANPVFPYPERIFEVLRRDRWPWLRRDLTQGLELFGRQLIAQMCEHGILIDISHASPTAREQVYDIAEGYDRPVVIASHMGAHSLNPNPYNLRDWEIRWIADHGGVIGVIFSNYILQGHEDTLLGLGQIARTLEHLINVGGSECVALGTDLDGFSNPPDDVIRMDDLNRLTQRLLVETFTGADVHTRRERIGAILGGNALRVRREGGQR